MIRATLKQQPDTETLAQMSGLLEGRVAVITGGARGIGLATAQVMVMQGAQVVIADNGCAIDGSPEDSVVAEAAVERCDAIAPGQASAWMHNLADRGAAAALIDHALKQFGAVDILVNAAAISRPDNVLNGERDSFDFVIANNLSAAFACMSAAAKAMREQVRKGRLPGSMVNLITAASIYGTLGRAAEVAAKAGLWGLTRTSAMDLKELGITCNGVMPFAATRMLQAAVVGGGESAQSFLAANRSIGTTHAANFITWLASPQASAISGQLLAVRGREILLFGQARPVRTVFSDAGALEPDALAHAIMEQFSPEITDLLTDHDMWSGDPVL